MEHYSNEIVDMADDGTNDYVVRETRSNGMAPVVNRTRIDSGRRTRPGTSRAPSYAYSSETPNGIWLIKYNLDEINVTE